MIRFIIIHFSITKISIIIIFHLKRMLFERSKTLNLNFYDSFFVSPDCLFGSCLLYTSHIKGTDYRQIIVNQNTFSVV